MLEKFLGKSKSEKERKPEQIAELGKKTILREADLEIEPKRSGGYMLCTILGMALAMGAMAGKAEGQVIGVGPQSWGGGREFVGQVFHQSVSEFGSALDRAQNAKQDRIEHEYTARLTQLGDAMRELDNQFSNQRARMRRQGSSPADLRNLENSYRAKKAQLMEAEENLKREYAKKKGGGLKRALIDTAIREARGW